MYKIDIEITQNGIVKTITDDNADGRNSKFIQKKSYIFDDLDSRNIFIEDICRDVGISTYTDIKPKENKITIWKRIKRFFS